MVKKLRSSSMYAIPEFNQIDNKTVLKHILQICYKVIKAGLIKYISSKEFDFM
jgi:hypothetical protein